MKSKLSLFVLLLFASLNANATLGGTYVGQITVEESTIEYVLQVDANLETIIYKDFRYVVQNAQSVKTEVTCKGKIASFNSNEFVTEKLNCQSSVGVRIPPLEAKVKVFGNVHSGKVVKTEVSSSHLRPRGIAGLFANPVFSGLIFKYNPQAITAQHFLSQMFRVRFATFVNGRLLASSLDIAAIKNNGNAKLSGYLAGRDSGSVSGTNQFGYGLQSFQPAQVEFTEQNILSVFSQDDAQNAFELNLNLQNLIGKDLLQFMLDLEQLSPEIENRYIIGIYINGNAVQTHGLTYIFSPSTSSLSAFFK